MRLGLMIGTDKERERGERLRGLVADVQAADQAGFASIWIPQVPGYLDAMTAIGPQRHHPMRPERQVIGSVLVASFA